MYTCALRVYMAKRYWKVKHHGIWQWIADDEDVDPHCECSRCERARLVGDENVVIKSDTVDDDHNTN